MTLQEALTIALAARAKPEHRQPLDKLQGSVSAAQLSANAVALKKSYDVMGGTLAKAQAKLAQLNDAVEYLQDDRPGKPLRRFHS
jgi:hypothetical protein